MSAVTTRRLKARPRMTMTDLGAREYIKLLLPFVALVVVGVAGRVTYPHDWPAHDWADAFFEACAIAGLIALLIELSAAKRLITHVADTLAGRLVGYGLPRELQELMSQTLKTGFVMHNVVKSYRFVDRSDGAFDVEMTHEYSVVNYGERTEIYKPHLSEEKAYEPRFLRLDYGPSGNENSFEASALQSLARIGKSERAMEVDAPHGVLLRRFRDNPSAPDKCKVFWQWTVQMPREYSDIIAFGAAAIGVTVRCVGGPSDLVFVVGGPGIEQGSDTSRNWVSNNAFLPSQHIRVWWRSSAAHGNG